MCGKPRAYGSPGSFNLCLISCECWCKVQAADLAKARERIVEGDPCTWALTIQVRDPAFQASAADWGMKQMQDLFLPFITVPSK